MDSSGAASGLAAVRKDAEVWSAAQMGASRTSALADLELQKARDIQMAAQNIEALKGMLGGL